MREAIRILIAAIIILFAVWLYGCATSPMSAPSGAGVSSGISSTQSSVSNAQRYNDVAVVHNAKAQTNVQRIEAKAQVVEKYWSK